ncbi:MAG TPA: hypothetical protein VMQ51_03905, partial [Candidatus Binatia bacterium]|nr:hypothetical protein [Candidatus Binatia bacterium]
TDNQTTVTAQPSGFILNTSSFTTTAGAANSIVQVASVRLDPTTLNSSQTQEVRGGATIMVPVTSSDPTVGTITTSPLTFPAGVSTVNTQFDPVAVGTSQITVGVPSGFDTPSNFQQITVTVNP